MPLPVRVRDVMSSPAITITADTTASDAATTCLERDINSLVVVDDGEVTGIVTGTDLLELLGTPEYAGDTTVSEVMSSPVETTAPASFVSDAVATMFEKDVARLAVLDGGELVGLVSTDDVIRYVPQVYHRQELVHESSDGAGIHAGRPEMAYENEDWEVTEDGLADDRIGVGDRLAFTKTISEQDVRTFAAVSGDTNRIHLDDAYAAQTRFGRRIAHGTLVSGLISAALARLPGMTIYLSQDLSFLAPVEIGERVTAVCEVTGTFGEDKYELTTDVYTADGEQVIEGEATVLIHALPDGANAESESVS